MGLLDDMDKRRERSERDRENSARLAQSYSIFRTTGQGTHQYEERVQFGLTFIEKPLVAYGSFCDIDELADALDIEDSDDAPLPVTAGFVVNWDQDDRDFYIGCWVGVRVNFPVNDDVDGTAPVEIEHHFTFAGIGMKDIPPSAGDAVI